MTLFFFVYTKKGHTKGHTAAAKSGRERSFHFPKFSACFFFGSGSEKFLSDKHAVGAERYKASKVHFLLTAIVPHTVLEQTKTLNAKRKSFYRKISLSLVGFVVGLNRLPNVVFCDLSCCLSSRAHVFSSCNTNTSFKDFPSTSF